MVEQHFSTLYFDKSFTLDSQLSITIVWALKYQFRCNVDPATNAVNALGWKSHVQCTCWLINYILVPYSLGVVFCPRL